MKFARSVVLALALSVLPAHGTPFLPSAEAAKVSKLTGFQDLKWGDSVASVKKKLGRRYKFLCYNNAGSPVYLGAFGGYRNVFFVPFFKAGHLTTLRVTVSAQDGKNTLGVWTDLSNKVYQVYGNSLGFMGGFYDSDVRVDSRGLQAMSSEEADRMDREVLNGRAWYMVSWQFRDGNGIDVETFRLTDSPEGHLFVGVTYYSPQAERTADASTLGDF